MYNYKKTKNSGEKYARFNGALITTFEIFLQILLILGVIKKFIYPGIDFLLANVFLDLFVFIVAGILIFQYYNLERIDKNFNNQRYSPTNFHRHKMALNMLHNKE